MPLRFHRRISLAVLLAIALVAAAWGILRLRLHHELSSTRQLFENSTTSSTNQTPEPQPAPTELDDSDAIEFAELAQTEISQLPAAGTLAHWSGTHANEVWEVSADEDSYGCRSYMKKMVLPSDRRVIIRVHFSPPEVPIPAVLPTQTGQTLLEETCTLAKINVETRAVSDADGVAMAQTLRQEFADTYGSSIGLQTVAFAGSGFWKETARWNGDLEIVTAFDPSEKAHKGPPPDAGAIFAFAALPTAYATESHECCTYKAYRYRETEDEQFKQAMSMTGVKAEISAPISTLYQKAVQAIGSAEEMKQTASGKFEESLVAALRDWLAAVKDLPPAQHAAGLYVADRLLASAEGIDPALGDPRKAEPRNSLEKLGATFQIEELGNTCVYSSNWLTQARELDSEGKVGQMATVIWIEHGGVGFAAKEHDVFRRVITEGERLLSQSLDARTAALVHFAVGDAYSDIVALAGGAEPEYGDPSKYRDEAGSARSKALEHYRAGLAMDGTSQNAKDAWQQAWHISAGLLPTTRYVYIYD